MGRDEIEEKLEGILRDLGDCSVEVREKAASNLEDIKYDLLKYMDLSLLKKVVPKLM